MKKAKILLSAAGILSVIAGAFAFKAQHKFTGRYFCTAITSATSYYTTKFTTLAPNTSLYCSTAPNVQKTVRLAVAPLI